SAMFLAMVWHARRRQDALRVVERESAERSALLAQQKRFLHDVSHELRTPVTIARGHLEVLRRLNGKPAQEIEVALDELGRIAHDALLEDAVKYTKGADAIVLSARAAGRVLEIEVADEGQGLPPGASERIFDRFARADVARSRAQGGAGLGLAIVDAIVKAHGGSCRAANSGGAGAIFTLRFPGFAPAADRESGARAGLAVPS